MAWYDEIQFFTVELTNKQHINWWTTLSLEEAKEAIGKNAFVTIGRGREEGYKEAEYNTKTIMTIKDYTEQERKRHQRQEEIIEQKLQVVKELRTKHPSFWTRKKIKHLDRLYTSKELDWYERYMGVQIDPLLICQLDELKKMLTKCK